MKSIYLRLYDIILTALTVIAGLCLMAACLGVYNSGGQQPYTPEKVAQAFASIAVPIWLWGALALGRVVLHIAFPTQAKKAAGIPAEMTLQRLQQRTDLSACPPELRNHVLALRNDRKKDARNLLLLFLGCSAVFLFYGLDPSHYYADRINTAVITAWIFLLICITAPFVQSIFALSRTRHSIRIETQLLQTAPSGAKIKPPAPEKNSGVTAARGILLVAALGLLVYGFFAGGTADVLTKAVNICTECVGLG